jgi:hypothetical protein
MMFGIWRRGGGGRGFITLRLISFSLALIGFLVALAVGFVVPTQQGISIPDAPQPIGAVPTPIAIPTSGGLGLGEVVILVVVCLAIGALLGAWMRSRSSAQKLKNEDVVVEKKKNRLEAQYAHTSDGDTLEVVEDDGKSITL